ncbi:MAG TPA: caspase family protein [Hyphomonas sp.]|nr:caspase family protein [Hyphomonas sp.]
MRWFLVSVLFAFFSAGALAETRMALVISQTEYNNSTLSRVSSAESEGNAIADALSATGFAVSRVRNLTRSQLNAELDSFRKKVDRAGSDAIGFVYYTGHGIQNPETSESFLLGIDSDIEVPSDLARYGISLDEQKTLFAATGAQAVFMVFDACRNVPSLPGFKSGTKGLSRTTAQTNMLIAYATDAGDVAQEGLYAPILASELRRPMVSSGIAFLNTQLQVAQKSGERQRPWTDNKIYKMICFAGCDAQAAAPTPVAMSAGTKEVLTESREGLSQYEAVGKAYFQAISGGGGSRIAGDVNFFAMGCGPATVWDENSCQAIVADGEDGKTHLMNALSANNIDELLPIADLKRIYADLSDPTYEPTRQMLGYLSAPGNGWYSYLEGPGQAKQLLRDHLKLGDPYEIGKAYAQAIMGGSGPKANGVVDFNRLGCGPSTVWDEARCQKVVLDGKDGKSFLMSVITPDTINDLLPRRDLMRISTDLAYRDTWSMLQNLSTPGNGWFTQFEGEGKAKQVLRQQMVLWDGEAIGRAYFQAISGGAGLKSVGQISFTGIGCNPSTVWNEASCQTAVASGKDGKTFMMEAITPGTIDDLLPMADLRRIYSQDGYQATRDMLFYLSKAGNGWFDYLEGPGGAKALLRERISAAQN